MPGIIQRLFHVSLDPIPAPRIQRQGLLTGTVVGDLSASVDLHDGYVVADQEVFRFACQPLRKDGRMFEYYLDLIKHQTVTLI